jgi:type IV pilus assembly protein PilV
MKSSIFPINPDMMRYRKNKGVSLLETVLALVIVTIGLLGSLQLFSNSIKGTTGADFDVTASELSTQLIERMRSNNSAGTAYNTPVNCSPATQCIQTSNSDNISCSTTEIAKFDLQQFSCDNGMLQALPSGSLHVNCNDTAIPECTIVIGWRTPLDSSTQTITNNIKLGRSR